MIIDHLMAQARACLFVIDADSDVLQVAHLMSVPKAEFVVACRGERAVGILTRSDIIGWLAHSRPNAARTDVAQVMTQPLIGCAPDESLIAVWRRLIAYGLQRAPILDPQRRPVGVISQRDLLCALLQQSEHEDEVLREYIQGVGYH